MSLDTSEGGDASVSQIPDPTTSLYGAPTRMEPGTEYPGRKGGDSVHTTRMSLANEEPYFARIQEEQIAALRAKLHGADAVPSTESMVPAPVKAEVPAETSGVFSRVANLLSWTKGGK